MEKKYWTKKTVDKKIKKDKKITKKENTKKEKKTKKYIKSTKKVQKNNKTAQKYYIPPAHLVWGTGGHSEVLYTPILIYLGV